MITLQIKRGDVIACKYKVFNNDPKASHHPFVVVSTKGGRIKIVVCTDARHANKFTKCVNLDYQNCGLRKPTVAICSKYSYLNNSDITTCIGHLSSSDYRNIVINIYTEDDPPKYFENWRQLI